MKDWLARKNSRLLDMLSQRRRIAKYADAGAHMRGAPDRYSTLPSNFSQTLHNPFM